jgi:hypothetical protein
MSVANPRTENVGSWAPCVRRATARHEGRAANTGLQRTSSYSYGREDTSYIACRLSDSLAAALTDEGIFVMSTTYGQAATR